MRWLSKWTRDRVIFIAGLAGVIYETLIGEADRPALLVLFASMMGLPAFLRKDDKDEAKRTDGDSSTRSK